jgi:hypothetical protein
MPTSSKYRHSLWGLPMFETLTSVVRELELEWANRTGTCSANTAAGQMLSPAETEVTIAGAEVAMNSGSGIVATTGAITRSRGESELLYSVVPMYPSIIALASVAAMAPTSEVALGMREQLLGLAVSETGLEPLGKVRGWLYRGEVSEQERARRIFASCFAQLSHSAICRCMRTSSIPARVSSTKARC